jgi:hypothetical protein
MGTTATKKPDPTRRGRSGDLRTLVPVVSLLAASAAHAEFEPQVTVGITHTDNVFLQAEDKQSDIVYRLEPSFHFAKETKALTLNADYLLQAFRYRDLGETEVFHQYQASARAALIPDTFFLEAGGSRDQAIVDPDLTIPSSNLPISGNRQNRDEYYVAPSFQYAFGSDVAATGEYRLTWLEFEEDQAQSSRQGSARFSLDNYRRERGVSWALRYAWERAEYDLDEPWEYQRATAELGFWAAAHTRFFASAGMESAWDAPLDPKLEDDLWEAGVSQQLGERLSAEFAAGERSFGSSWRGDLRFRFRRGSTSLSYSETPTTEGHIRIRRSAFDGIEVPQSVLLRPGSTERFIAKNLMWTLDFQLRRTGLALSVFDSDRVGRTEADGTPLPDESERGASCSLSYKLGARTTLSLGAWWAERELQIGKSELVNGYFEVGYRLGRKTSLALNYAYAEEDPEGLASALDYAANTVSLDLTRAF